VITGDSHLLSVTDVQCTSSVALTVVTLVRYWLKNIVLVKVATRSGDMALFVVLAKQRLEALLYYYNLPRASASGPWHVMRHPANTVSPAPCEEPLRLAKTTVCEQPQRLRPPGASHAQPRRHHDSEFQSHLLTYYRTSKFNVNAVICGEGVRKPQGNSKVVGRRSQDPRPLTPVPLPIR
jgi:hypothetical protein